MLFQRSIAAWFSAWRDIGGWDDLPAYRQLSWWRQRQLDLLALWRGLRSEGFWRAAGIVLIAALVIRILGWHWDLTQWQLDLARCLPAILAVPWLAAARKRHIRAVQHSRDPRADRS